MVVIVRKWADLLRQVWNHHLWVQTCPRDKDLLNSWVREDLAMAEPCNMPLEIPSGPEDICLRMEDNRWKTLSSEQEISESSGGGEFSTGGSKGSLRVRENFGDIAIQEIILYSRKFSHGVKFRVFRGMLNTWHHSGLELKKQYTNVVQYGECTCNSTVATLPVAVSRIYHLTWTAKKPSHLGTNRKLYICASPRK